MTMCDDEQNDTSKLNTYVFCPDEKLPVRMQISLAYMANSKPHPAAKFEWGY